jgi:hypothetical protein
MARCVRRGRTLVRTKMRTNRKDSDYIAHLEQPRYPIDERIEHTSREQTTHAKVAFYMIVAAVACSHTHCSLAGTPVAERGNTL